MAPLYGLPDYRLKFICIHSPLAAQNKLSITSRTIILSLTTEIAPQGMQYVYKSKGPVPRSREVPRAVPRVKGALPRPKGAVPRLIEVPRV